MNRSRRRLLATLPLPLLLPALSACSSLRPRTAGHVVVVGGGFGGATVARYLRLWSEGAVRVTLVERNPAFVSCPFSNLVIGGMRRIDEITHGYETLRQRWGVEVVHDEVLAVDAQRRRIRLQQQGEIAYDRLVLSPGVDFLPEALPGLKRPGADERVVHAWKAGPQTVALRRQLAAMPDGGTYAIAIPRAPYRCPPGPYERASLVASYFKQAKPNSRVLVLDGNDEIQSKKGLFLKAWNELYPGMIEYRPGSEVRDVDARAGLAILDFDQVRADVLNVIPPQRAGAIAVDAGLANVNQRWCAVDWLTMESTAQPGIHVLGDAVFPAPTMPKSGHMANQQGKLAAAAILKLLAGEAPDPAPVLMNTCYSFVDRSSVIHVASVHQYDAAKRMPMPVAGAGGVSAERNAMEAAAAQGWARNIWADMLG